MESFLSVNSHMSSQASYASKGLGTKRTTMFCAPNPFPEMRVLIGTNQVELPPPPSPSPCSLQKPRWNSRFSLESEVKSDKFWNKTDKVNTFCLYGYLM
jgi:hypothetical protein